MRLALEEAKLAAARDEVPVGAVLVHEPSQEIIAQAGNRTRELKDPTAHAEILTIREACKIQDAQRIPNTILYVSLEPCSMCTVTWCQAPGSSLLLFNRDEKKTRRPGLPPRVASQQAVNTSVLAMLNTGVPGYGSTLSD